MDRRSTGQPHKEDKLKSAVQLALLSLLSFGIFACASQPLPPPDWNFEKDAIYLHVKADNKLNMDEGTPHTLMFCVYQLKDPNAFNQLSSDMAGIYELLKCGLFDGSVATSKSYIIHPGQDLDITIDRAQDAQYVAVVGGYFVLEKERMTRLYKIPVLVEEKGFIKRTKIQKPEKLKVELILGPQQFQ